MYRPIVTKSKVESRAHYAPEPTRDTGAQMPCTFSSTSHVTLKFPLLTGNTWTDSTKTNNVTIFARENYSYISPVFVLTANSHPRVVYKELCGRRRRFCCCCRRENE